MKLSIANILSEHFKKLGYKGGKKTSKAKAAASRKNGAKGGRPKSDKPKAYKRQTVKPI